MEYDEWKAPNEHNEPTDRWLEICQDACREIATQALIENAELRRLLRQVAPIGTDLLDFVILSVRSPNEIPTDLSPALDDLASPQELARILSVSIRWKQNQQSQLRAVNDEVHGVAESERRIIQRSVETESIFWKTLDDDELLVILNTLEIDRLVALARFVDEDRMCIRIASAAHPQEQSSIDPKPDDGKNPHQQFLDTKKAFLSSLLHLRDNAGFSAEDRGNKKKSVPDIGLQISLAPINNQTHVTIQNIIECADHPDELGYEIKAHVCWSETKEHPGKITRTIDKKSGVPWPVLEEAWLGLPENDRQILLQQLQTEALGRCKKAIAKENAELHVVPVNIDGALDRLQEIAQEKMQYACSHLLNMHAPDPHVSPRVVIPPSLKHRLSGSIPINICDAFNNALDACDADSPTADDQAAEKYYRCLFMPSTFPLFSGHD